MKLIKLFIISLLLGAVLSLQGCYNAETLSNDLATSGYELIQDEIQANDAYVSYSIYDETSIVGVIYEFPSFVKARNYLHDHDDEDITEDWIIHNQFIIISSDDEVVSTITKSPIEN